MSSAAPPDTAAPNAAPSNAAVRDGGVAGGFEGPLPAARTHYPALDGLRGLAILLVMVSHYVAPPAGGGRWGLVFRRAADAGWVGVDLFFALSGFLITGILLDAKGKPGFFRNFFARRTLRVFPLYYGVLFVVCVLLPALGLLKLGVPLSQRWLWLYATNLFPLLRSADGAGFFFPNSWDLQFGHFWSLAVEEHFYLAWPLVVYALGRRPLMVTCAALMVA
ncbi:MAG TPA: acyltransferase, partial [Tepidisphaeraceae bacterium]|nr:acyltransferase [Tepidisphaeraceae bacterium]